jgi:2-(1,2-epoxy-1,2-dihydrophenyl)acetyl-CoA isomerase/putative hydratase
MANPPSHETLDFSIDDRVAYSTFARPEVLNSLSEQSLDDLNDVVARVQRDHHLRALVVRGQGDAFCVGLEPELLATAFADMEYYEHVLTRVAATCLSLEALEVPVIAAVNGTASEVGFELALACDFIVIADEAQIGDGRGHHGRVPGGGATVRLPRAVGAQHAREILYSSRLVPGKEAAAIGLALRSVPVAQLDAEVAQIAAGFANKSRTALATVKRQINGGLGLDTPSGMEHERSEFLRYLREPGSDAVEGYRASQEDRLPSWD